MLAKEKGVCSGSDLYFQTPSENARRLLYYMTSCGSFYTDYDYRIERENYGNFMLFYICSGRLSVRSENTTLVADAGQIGFLNCHVPHEYHTIGNTEFVWVHLDGVNTAQLYEQVCGRQGKFVFTSPCAPEIRKRIYELIFACRNDHVPNEVRLSEKLYGLLATFLDSESTEETAEDGEASPVQEARDFIQKHYHEDISLEDVARSVNMSKYYFSRLFKKTYGYSPHEFVILTRLNSAKHLLKTTDLPIKNIAQEVGYQNVTTFTNSFTAQVGVSPSQFRKFPL